MKNEDTQQIIDKNTPFHILYGIIMGLIAIQIIGENSLEESHIIVFIIIILMMSFLYHQITTGRAAIFSTRNAMFDNLLAVLSFVSVIYWRG